MKKLLYVLPFILLFSCAVQKRKYMKGFYVDNHKTFQKSRDYKYFNTIETNARTTFSLTNNKNECDNYNLEASANNKITPNTKSSIFSLPKDSACDMIIFNNGNEVSAKVLEITSIEVKYKKCEFADGPLYVANKTDIFMIKYANGLKDVFKSSEKLEYHVQNSNSKKTSFTNYKKKIQPLSILSVVFGVLGIWPLPIIGGILAITIGNKAIKLIDKNPEIYRGKDLANVGKYLGYIFLSLFGLACLIFAVLFLILLFTI